MKKQLLLVVLLSTGAMNVEAVTSSETAPLTLVSQKVNAGTKGMNVAYVKFVNKLRAISKKATTSKAVKTAIRYGLTALYSLRFGTGYGKSYLNATKPGATTEAKNIFLDLQADKEKPVSQAYKTTIAFLVNLIQENEGKILGIIGSITDKAGSVLSVLQIVPSDLNKTVTDLLKAFLTNTYVTTYTAIKGSSLTSQEKAELEEAKNLAEADIEQELEISADDL